MERGVLLAVLYADLFDYPLTRDELYRRLVGIPCRRADFEEAVNVLVGRYLSETSGYLSWVGREHLVALRERRSEASERLWGSARRYAAWLARMPFIRMVAVSGSLAVDNSKQETDIDFFCVTEANRLWLTRLWLVPISRLTGKLSRLFPVYLCPNYMLSLSGLEVKSRNLYTASEVAQAVPLWGRDAYQRFRAANCWVTDFLPHARLEERLRSLAEPHRPWLTRAYERLLGGRLGDALDRWAHAVFVTLYRRRARRRNWRWEELAPAYRKDRYTVPEGGYLPVVRRLFLERLRERMGSEITDEDVESLFAPLPTRHRRTSGCRDWEALFARDYSAAGGAEAADVQSGMAPTVTAPEREAVG